jgi:hypothetical protein
MTTDGYKVIDGHVHIFPPEVIQHKERYLDRDRWFGELYGRPTARLATWQQVMESMDRAGVSQSVVFGFAWADPGLCREHNDYVIDAVRASAGRLLGLAVVSPAAPGAAAEAERCLREGLAGVGELYPDGQNFDPGSEPDMLELVEVLQAWGAVMLIHASEPVGHVYPGKGHTTPDKLYAMALRFPDLRLVLAHWGGGLAFYELMPEVKEALRNVYYDTAATTYLYSFDIFPRVIDIVGPYKVIFGSDYPLLDQQKFLQRVKNSGLQAEELRAVLAGNAEEVFGKRLVR